LFSRGSLIFSSFILFVSLQLSDLPSRVLVPCVCVLVGICWSSFECLLFHLTVSGFKFVSGIVRSGDAQSLV
jgi:hypothetical protein